MDALHPDHALFQKHASDFWYARASIALIAGLQLLVINQELTIGPRGLAPGLELAILAPLSVATAWNQNRARRATKQEHWESVLRHRAGTRMVALSLTGAIMVINLIALVSVTRALLHGTKGPSGQSLLIDALNIWFTNVLIFGLWYWNLDRAGPASRGLGDKRNPDFLFPQMLGPGDEDPGWTPSFFDYFYVSFTNSTAFSPTDTMPLSQRSKLLMMIQAAISLLTVGLVAARAVNILS